ncbi:hypothetical protein [Methylorubrum podarium]|jgi:hypothetical protein|uniref:hypothetical protein n=1 Tax=Methylorubrum podarium TaxID=200476 RepID=UPI001EE17469|nr:hypothetical protein [Methylorubrum podarium]GJE68648.1 hypothetical protein CHKEEEPN_0164 [Methylorubrum podarium]
MSLQPDPSADMPDFDGLRVQVPGEHQIWLVFGDRRHYITDLNVLRALFRDDAFQTDAECARLPEGSVLGPGSRLVRGKGSASVHLVVSSDPGQETRHRVVDAAQFERYGFDPAKVEEIPPETLRNIRIGLPLGPRAAAAALAERENLERLVEELHPGRPTLLLLLEERDAFVEQFAGHVQESARRRVHVLLGWLEDGQFAISSGPPDAPDALVARLPESALTSVAETLRIGRIDVLATRFGAALRTVVEALGRPFDLTPMVVPSAREETDGAMQALARRAARVIACGDAMLSALRTRFPGHPIATGLDPEARKPSRFRVHPARLDADEDLRVLIWGPTSEPESRVVAETVAPGRDGGLAVRFFGLDGTPAASLAGLRDLGPADRFDLNRLACVLRPHLVWFPSPAPEAFDFRVSAALAQGLPILASAACGLSLRLADRPYTWILPADATAASIREELTAIRARWASEYGRLHRAEAAPGFYPATYLDWSTVGTAPPDDAIPLAPAPPVLPPSPAPIPAKKKWRFFK